MIKNKWFLLRKGQQLACTCCHKSKKTGTSCTIFVHYRERHQINICHLTGQCTWTLFFKYVCRNHWDIGRWMYLKWCQSMDMWNVYTKVKSFVCICFALCDKCLNIYFTINYCSSKVLTKCIILNYYYKNVRQELAYGFLFKSNTIHDAVV